MKKVDLSIIIVNYNVKAFLLNLLSSLEMALKDYKSEIIVVDNASEDGSVEAVRKKYPKVNLIASNENLGFGKANNLALKKAKGKYIVLINPDTIVKENSFSNLIKFFEETPEAGIAGCKVLNPDGSLQLACRRSFPGPWTSFTKVSGLSRLFPKNKIFARYNLTYLDEDSTYEVDAISGAFMMLRKEVYEKVGGFDEQFFMYGEDLDLCYRIQKSGYKVYYVHTTEIIHYKGESTRRSNLDETKVFYGAMTLFVKKHFSSSFIVRLVLESAILLRKFVAFLNIYSLVIVSIVLDFLFFIIAMVLAEKFYISDKWLGFPIEVRPWIFVLPALLQILISGLMSVYRKNTLSVLKTLTALPIGFLLLTSSTFFLKQYAFSRAVILITYGLALSFFIFWRFIAKVFFKIGVASDSHKMRTLIVGTGAKASELALKLKNSISSNYHVVGLIGLSRTQIGELVGEFEVLGYNDNINRIIIEKKIDKVIFSSDEIKFDQMFSAVSISRGSNVEFLVAGHEQEYLVGKSAVTLMDNIALLKVDYNISSWILRFLKRGFDLGFSTTILFLVFPFIYCFRLITKRSGDFINFICGVPSVMIGKKSFVGPKSESHLSDLYLGKIGLTGLWYTEQIDASDSDETNKLNIYYARNQNVWLDLEIIGKSLAKMLSS